MDVPAIADMNVQANVTKARVMAAGTRSVRPH
jgi:hypothetical protein